MEKGNIEPLLAAIHAGGRVTYRNLEEVGMKLPRAGFAPFGASPFC